MSQPSPFLSLLYQALASPIGLLLEVSDFKTVQQRLYAARTESQDPDLACLQFRRSPWDQERELCILKGGRVALPPTGEA